MNDESRKIRQIRKNHEWLAKKLKDYRNKETPEWLKVKVKAIFKKYREG